MGRVSAGWGQGRTESMDLGKASCCCQLTSGSPLGWLGCCLLPEAVWALGPLPIQALLCPVVQFSSPGSVKGQKVCTCQEELMEVPLPRCSLGCLGVATC